MCGETMRTGGWFDRELAVNGDQVLQALNLGAVVSGSSEAIATDCHSVAPAAEFQIVDIEAHARIPFMFPCLQTSHFLTSKVPLHASQFPDCRGHGSPGSGFVLSHYVLLILLFFLVPTVHRGNACWTMTHSGLTSR